MVEATEEMKKLATAAATAYVTGIRVTDMKDSVDRFLDAYNYALKKIWLRSHKENAMRDIASGSSFEDEKID